MSRPRWSKSTPQDEQLKWKGWYLNVTFGLRQFFSVKHFKRPVHLRVAPEPEGFCFDDEEALLANGLSLFLAPFLRVAFGAEEAVSVPNKVSVFNVYPASLRLARETFRVPIAVQRRNHFAKSEIAATSALRGEKHLVVMLAVSTIFKRENFLVPERPTKDYQCFRLHFFPNLSKEEKEPK